MQSTVNKVFYPVIAVIENGKLSYAGDGNKQMDKTGERIYTNETQSLFVESYFVGTDSVHNLLKRFLKEQNNHEIKVANTMPPQYNEPSNTVVAASTKEGGE